MVFYNHGQCTWVILEKKTKTLDLKIKEKKESVNRDFFTLFFSHVIPDRFPFKWNIQDIFVSIYAYTVQCLWRPEFQTPVEMKGPRDDTRKVQTYVILVSVMGLP